MFKIIKSKVVAAEGTDKLGVNSNYRNTIGYNSQTKTISVLVEKVVREDLNREEDAPLTYLEVDSREFTTLDFPQTTDHMSWFVEFDVQTGKISNPIESLEWAKNLPNRNSVFHHGGLQTAYLARYSEDLLPLIYINSFNKNATDFSSSLLQIWEAPNTIINATAEELLNMEKHHWLRDNVFPEVEYEILDANGDAVTAPLTLQGNNLKNQYTVTLPAADEYTIRHIFTKPNFETIENTYDVNIVNGSSTKNRIVIAEGQSDVLINTRGLSAGDFTKVKLNSGKYTGFSELWITYQ